MQHISLNIRVFSVYIPLFILNKYKYNEKIIVINENIHGYSRYI